eukprot:2249375-Rhodomonas_salina.5
MQVGNPRKRSQQSRAHCTRPCSHRRARNAGHRSTVFEGQQRLCVCFLRIFASCFLPDSVQRRRRA